MCGNKQRIGFTTLSILDHWALLDYSSIMTMMGKSYIHLYILYMYILHFVHQPQQNRGNKDPTHGTFSDCQVYFLESK